ncbi:MAG: glycosyltransferase family 39 protein [Candidatus Sumerlaeia bacterium]|nr:glycosyltransferase family 39 protein [Candidatus Sumerlaeia bacterium]
MAAVPAGGVVPAGSFESRAAAALLAAAAVSMALLAITPDATAAALLARLAPDGELGPATRSTLRVGRLAAVPALAMLGLAWFRRDALRRGLAWLLAVLAAVPHGRWMALLGCVALAPRLAWVALVPSIPWSDFLEYHELAERLLETGRFATAEGAPTAFRPMGYPAFLAAVYALGGGIGAVGVLNALFGAATSLLTWELARHRGGEGPARLAALFVALMPSQIGYTSLLAAEVPFTAAALGSLVLAQRAFAERSGRAWWLAAACGALLGAALMLRAHAAAAALAIALAGALAGRRALGLVAVVAVVSAVLPAAWGLRNLRELGAFVPFSTNGGVNLHFGNNGMTNGTGLELLDPQKDATSGIADEVERSRAGTRLALDFWREHPEALPALAARKLFWFSATDGVWTHWAFGGLPWERKETARRAALALATLAHALLLAAALFELALFRRRADQRASAEPLAEWYLAFTVLLAVVAIAQERYRFPVAPVLAMAAGLLAARFAARDQRL